VRARRSAGRRIRAHVVGIVSRIDDAGQIFVRRPGAKRSILARSIVDLSTADVGAQVLLSFERGNPRLPFVLGRIRQRAGQLPVDVALDGQSITLSGEQEVTLRCGKSSITLTRAGKVLINGAYLLSRSTGVNRIKGGSVQIN
jgi:hypothetical protein